MTIDKGLHIAYPFDFTALAVILAFLLILANDGLKQTLKVTASGSVADATDVEHTCNDGSVGVRFMQEANGEILQVDAQAMEVGVWVVDSLCAVFVG